MAGWNVLLCDHCGAEYIVQVLRWDGVVVSVDEYVEQVRDHLAQIFCIPCAQTFAVLTLDQQMAWMAAGTYQQATGEPATAFQPRDGRRAVPRDGRRSLPVAVAGCR